MAAAGGLAKGRGISSQGCNRASRPSLGQWSIRRSRCRHLSQALSAGPSFGDDSGSASTPQVAQQALDAAAFTPAEQQPQPQPQQQQQQQQQQPDPEERKRLWKAAIKLPMYSVGIAPVLVGAAAAFGEAGAQIAVWRCLGMVVGAVFVIAWLNLSNDAFDATTGVDKTKPESIVNLTGNRSAVLVAAKLFLAAGAWLLAASIGAAGDTRVAAMLAAAIACGYVYQGPPFRFSYKGLGEPLCFVAFGPLATTAFYLALAPHQAPAAAAAAAAAPAAVPPNVWVAAVLVGVTTSVILFCSHFHQIAGDIAAGKRSPLVRLGTEKGTRVLSAAVVGTYAFAIAATAAGALPLAVPLFALASVPAARAVIAYAEANHTVPAAIAPLKRYAIKWHVAFSLALVAGLVASGAGLGGTTPWRLF